MRRDGAFSGCLLLLLLLVVGLTVVSLAHAQQTLAPLGTPIPPYRSGDVEQMAYDPTGRSLYLANAAYHTIVQVGEVTSAPLTPLTGTPWTYSIVAGKNGARNTSPGSTEVRNNVATFNNPSGVAGWPQYAVGPYGTAAADGGATWVGLWIADIYNHALRFVNFGRGNNVTLVAGSPSGLSGARDGTGATVLANRPENVAWGRFLRNRVINEGNGAPVGSWTSVVYFSDSSNNCIRQGVPVHNISASIDMMASKTLEDMALNVSTFAGTCGTGGGGAGAVVPWSPMFVRPWGVAVVALSLPLNGSSGSHVVTTEVMLIGDYDNNRLSMIAPMYPASARFLTVISRSNGEYFAGVTVARLRSVVGSGSTGSGDVGVELIVGGGTSHGYKNISFMLHIVNATTISLAVTNVPRTTLATTDIGLSYYTALIPYTPMNRTLVVFSGNGGDVLQFYCCFDATYSEPIDVGGPMTAVEVRHSLATGTSSLPLTDSLSTRSEPSTTLARDHLSISVSSSSGAVSSRIRRRTKNITLASSSSRHYVMSRTLAAASVSPLHGSQPMNVGLTTEQGENVDTTATQRTQVVVSIISTAVLGTNIAGFSTARSLGVLSVAQRCYFLLFHGDVAANITAVNGSVRLEFPDSAWPGLRIGDDDVAYERGAAVAGMTVVLATTAFSVVLLATLLALLQPGGFALRLAVRLPIMAVVAVAGLLADGAVAGAALVGGAFTLLGLVVPLVIITLVAVAGLRRVAHFDARYLETTAPAHQVEALRAARKGVFGTMFVVFVGVGAWRLPEGAAPKMTLWGLSAPAALTGRYRGPDGARREQGAVERVCVYYLALDVALAAALSLCRGLLVSISCVAAAGVMAAVCLGSVVALLCLRPMTAPAKNVVAVGLAMGSTTSSLVLLGGMTTASRSAVILSIRVSQWVLSASTAAAIVTVVSALLKFAMHRQASKLKRATAVAAQLTMPMLPVPSLALGGPSAGVTVPAGGVLIPLNPLNDTHLIPRPLIS